MKVEQKTLVTGGCGFIGTHLVRRLVGAGHEVLNLDKLTYAARPEALADLEGTARYRLLRADLADRDAVREAFASFRPDAVVHLAAESHVDRSIAGPADFIHSNITGTFHLLEAARECWLHPSTPPSLNPSIPSPRFLHVSTDEVFGSLGPGDPPFTEASPYDPHSPYSASKAASDHLARAWFHTYGLPVIVSSGTNTYGPGQHPEKLVPLVILRALRGEPIPVYGDGGNVRDWLQVGDHVEALLAILARGVPGRTYAVGGRCERTNLDLVRLLCRLVDEETGRSGSGELITFVADRPGHDRRYALDPARTRAELGWEPKAELESALRETVRWMAGREQGSL